MKLSAGLFARLAAAIISPGQDISLESLPAWREFEPHRLASADPSGRNEDWRFLEPGATLVLADIQGPGCIVHIHEK